MKNLIVLVGVLCIVAAIPVPEKPQSSLDLLQIPLSGNKELDIVSLTDDNGKLTERNKRTIDILRQLFPTLTQAANSESGADQAAINEELVQTIRRVREAAAVAERLEKEKETTAQDKKFDVKVELPTDQDGEASETENKSAPLDELTLDNDADDENRNKRFLSFGASSGGSGGGSGNFLFDIVRLISGSSGTQDSDERANSPDAAAHTTSAEGYTEGIPGPVTRLVVLANRGLSNLIQDLILRLAQTSERVVNFKARLITSLI